MSVSLTAVLVVLVPVVVELSRAARSFERLCDTINRDLPPTLESLRQTTEEITQLTDDVHVGVQNAGQAVQQANQGLHSVQGQAKRAQAGTRSLIVGMKAAWIALTASESSRDRHQPPASTAPLRPVPLSQPPTTAPPPPIHQDNVAAAKPIAVDSDGFVDSPNEPLPASSATHQSDLSAPSTIPPATDA
ncbi:MAG: hypothetical protein ACFB0E_04880 [Leptolyngbyaceae cyanobacterium]